MVGWDGARFKWKRVRWLQSMRVAKAESTKQINERKSSLRMASLRRDIYQCFNDKLNQIKPD